MQRTSQSRMRRWLREPLLLFILGGTAIYSVLSWFEGRAETGSYADPIRIDRAALLEHIQFRAKTFDADFAEKTLDAMSQDAIAELINDVRIEEALYREARSLRLDRGDYIIRQRLIGKVGYLVEGDIATTQPSEAELQTYYDANKADYAVPATVTFRHRFFGKGEDAQSRAEAMLSDEDEPAGLVRFPYANSYADRTARFLTPIFGERMTRALFSESTPTDVWSGPFVSPLGVHRVQIVDRRAASTPELDDIRQVVTDDVIRQSTAQLNAALRERIVARYPVEIAEDIAPADPTSQSTER